MAAKRNVMILGASYCSLLGAKLALAGHDVHLVCLPDEAKLINAEGAIHGLHSLTPIEGNRVSQDRRDMSCPQE